MTGSFLPMLLAGVLVAADEPTAKVDYLRQVKPILAARCFACHAAIQQKAGLRVDSAAFLREGGNNGPAIVPGKSGDSALVKRIVGAAGAKRMPPEKEGEALKPGEIALIRSWIDQGAVASADEKPETDPREHWAFKKVVRPAVPQVKNPNWSRNPIDAFVARQHEIQGLTPQPDLEPSLWLRRVYLDLIGLPPTAKELDDFGLRIAELRKKNQGDTAAFEEVVDRLLASPQYGERWGRHWMDIWRYSDWWGLGAELRNSQKHIWHWRDWIVESLNKDKGYDRMILEMLAADELYPTDDNALRGTGFLARHYFKFNRTTWMDETVEHTAKAFLGLTMNCSKCHDHKYDPISQVDYYRFRAIFEPYQIRLDQVRGEADLEKNGMPRVFDCNLETPTFLHVRGNEASPDKERKITPGLPKLLAPAGLNIQPISLPPAAFQPGLRPFILEDLLKAVEKDLTAARAQLVKAKELLAALENKAPTEPKLPTGPTKATILAQEDFASLNKERWEEGPGVWRIENGKLEQHQDGDMRAALSLKQKPPEDFEARFKFSILGGKTYHSVGLAFDVTGTEESLVYLTAHAGDARVQFAYKQGSTYVYPPDARQPRRVGLKESQEMVIRVRGSLLNVTINGQLAFAYALPRGRHAGKIDLISFDAKARFEHFTLNTLPLETQLVQATGKVGAPVSVAQARAAVAVAEKMTAAAEASSAALKARNAADHAVARELMAATTKEAIQQAARAEKQLGVALAELNLAKAQEKNDAKLTQQATAAREAARKALAAPGETYTPIQGALKTLENNLETDAARRKPFPKVSTGRRAALAQWIANQDNPLTARVAVNHIWARHFGQPLVASVFDLGRKGIAPTHPELLDWLAAELMGPSPGKPGAPTLGSERNWSMKHIHRLIATSQAYRMTSSLAGAAVKNNDVDPDNRYLWRMHSQRMEAQVVRDSLLHLAGELDLKLGGPSIEMGQQDASKRRSLYFFHSAIERNRFLTTFDDADPLDCYRRRDSIVPQQALALANSQLALTMADKIAGRLDAKLADREYARQAFVMILAVEPTAEELSVCAQALTRWTEIYRQRPDVVRRARTQLIHALLNHNDFVTVR